MGRLRPFRAVTCESFDFRRTYYHSRNVPRRSLYHSGFRCFRPQPRARVCCGVWPCHALPRAGFQLVAARRAAVALRFPQSCPRHPSPTRNTAGFLMFAAALQLGQSTASPQRRHSSVRLRASFSAALAAALTFGRPLGVGFRPAAAWLARCGRVPVQRAARSHATASLTNRRPRGRCEMAASITKATLQHSRAQQSHLPGLWVAD
jgi:hypothetical protein